jgi:hypothetical protein
MQTDLSGINALGNAAREYVGAATAVATSNVK